jgi:hypothetical protein
MSIEHLEQSQEELLASKIFDMFAEAKREGQVAQDIGYRAVAAARIMAFTHGEQEWFRILDNALEERGVDAHYSSLTPFNLRAQSRLASDALTPITRRCRTVLQELEVLSTVGVKRDDQ